MDETYFMCDLTLLGHEHEHQWVADLSVKFRFNFSEVM